MKFKHAISYCIVVCVLIDDMLGQWGRNRGGSEDQSSPKFWEFIENNNNIWKKLVPILPYIEKFFPILP